MSACRNIAARLDTHVGSGNKMGVGFESPPSSHGWFLFPMNVKGMNTCTSPVLKHILIGVEQRPVDHIVGPVLFLDYPSTSGSIQLGMCL